MCFWYQTARPPGTGPVSSSVTRRQSSSCAARISSRPGWSMPVARRYAAYSGSSTTVVSARFSNARIIAVEMLRGPDHIAMRTGGGGDPSPVAAVMREPLYGIEP